MSYENFLKITFFYNITILNAKEFKYIWRFYDVCDGGNISFMMN